MPTRSFRQVLADRKPLILFGAYDALSARLIEASGGEAVFISGFSVVGARYGVPDFGLRAFGDIAAAVRDTLNAIDIPALVDADDGYGDVKNVIHTVQSYERMGVSALMLEDQRWPKRCGHMAGKAVVPLDEIVAKIKAACSERVNRETFIFARTDARAVNGLDDAMRRGEALLNAGADGLFIEAPESLDEFEAIGRRFDVPMIANPLPGGKSPLLRPEHYAELGFQVVCYGVTPIMFAAGAIRDRISDITSGRFALDQQEMSFAEFKQLVGLPRWERYEDLYGAARESAQ
ncbi:carboxyvinyl-carboxyphosphonate phosphorylmutase [Bradyrhizobium sp. SSBR45G]|uniref:isocitrate lyase/PEP mutase family protein n=1 Tax=unclassified Bradyrhizobium TaxID=2631580 RepID=UPI002342A966|nr:MULTISPECIES: isocitrate lyase/PEP mutase family protein [unclassified Bradyrhizobium]GLH76659.1 carboxyvinyl-carboxyphosphonate phosphorylmutase [Bradyrhizobium sp. SSBR45G]GLH84272.1 carboxyvinyl-carboxyphosphonate phosphorylmutase [Bradyrhizobium sp. SSBR45R]